MNALPIIAKLHEQVGTGHFYDDGYACFGGGSFKSRPATEAKRPANRDGAEAAKLIQELYDALVRLGTLGAAKYGSKDDELWAACTQGIVACAKARGEQSL